jgi:hypothetical protein
MNILSHQLQFIVSITTVVYMVYGLTGFGAEFISISKGSCADLPVRFFCDMFMAYHRSECKS